MNRSWFNGYSLGIWDQLQERAVYWLYDADDRLLYVGLTRRLRKRLLNHRSGSSWFDRVARVEFEILGAHIASWLERVEISREAPLFNRQANRRRGWDYGRGSGLRYFPERDEFATDHAPAESAAA